MSQYSPGPWKLCFHLADPNNDSKCPCGYRGDIWSGDGETVICQIGAKKEADGTQFLPVAERSVQLANARLIAAAPELLEALKAVVAVADRKTVEFDMARAAIAKATEVLQ